MRTHTVNSKIVPNHSIWQRSDRLKVIGFAIALIIGIGIADVFMHANKLRSISLITTGSVGGISLLIIAIVGCLKKRKETCELNEKNDSKSAYKQISLHQAAGNFHNVSRNYSTVKELIDQGADVNAKDEDDWTPLHNALNVEGNLQTVDLLIKKGASLKAKTKSLGHTPLHVAAGSFSNRYALLYIKLLLKNGAEIDARNGQNQTPLHRAASGPFATPIILELLLNKGAQINAQDACGYTPLHVACSRNNNSLVEYLIDWNADVNVQDAQGCTPLHIVCNDPHPNQYNIKYLMDHGADLNLKNSAGQTPQIPIDFDKNVCIFPPDPFKSFADKLIGEQKHTSPALELLKGYYSILEIDETASRSQIRMAYKKLALKYHPDKVAQKKGEKDTTFRKRLAENRKKFEDVCKAYRNTYYLT